MKLKVLKCPQCGGREGEVDNLLDKRIVEIYCEECDKLYFFRLTGDIDRKRPKKKIKSPDPQDPLVKINDRLDELEKKTQDIEWLRKRSNFLMRESFPESDLMKNKKIVKKIKMGYLISLYYKYSSKTLIYKKNFPSKEYLDDLGCDKINVKKFYIE